MSEKFRGCPIEPKIDVLDEHIRRDDHVGFGVFRQNGAVVADIIEGVFVLNVMDEVEFRTHQISIDTSLINTYNNGEWFIKDFNTFETKMGQAAVVIPEKIYFKIGEVCDLVGVQAHVLRYWETEFPMLSPQKNRSGQRSYRRRDVEIALRIKELLYDEMFTIAGAKKKLQAELRETSKLKIVHPEPKDRGHLKPVEAPSLFDEDEDEIEDLDMSLTVSQEQYEGLSAERREALKSLAVQLLELREMLKTDQTREAANHLRKY